jgi:prolipoprotein diacylglyceryl transferase
MVTVVWLVVNAGELLAGSLKTTVTLPLSSRGAYLQDREATMFEWNATPEIFHIGPLAIRWYSLSWIAAFVIGYHIFRWINNREQRTEHDLDSLFLYMLLGALIGARLGHCLFYHPTHYLTHPIDIIAIWKGGFRGLASHGGAIGILVALYLYVRKHPDRSYLPLVDRVVVPTALGGALIRMGNFFNSELYGQVTEVPWAVVFVRIDNLPRHPTQLYESFSYFVIFGLLLWAYQRSGRATPAGRLLGLFLALIFSARFVIEFFKLRLSEYGAELPLSTGQLLSVPMVVVGIALIVFSAREGGRSARGANKQAERA